MTNSMKVFKIGIMAHNSSPRTQGAEAEGSQVWGQFGARTSLKKKKLKRSTPAPSLQYCFINPCFYLKFSFFLFFLSALLTHKTACNHTAGHIISKQC